MRPPRDPRRILREELRAARVRAGLRQTEISARLGRPQSYLSKVESGERRLEFTEVLSICRILDLDPHELIDRLM